MSSPNRTSLRLPADFGTELGGRLLAVRKHLNQTQSSMDKLLGIGRRSWQRYESEGQTPGGKVFAGLSQLGFNANWILAGKGSMRIDGGNQSSAASENISIRQITDRSNPVAALGFNTDQMAACGVADEDLVVTTMKSDLMEPTIRRGALIVADGSVRKYRGAGLYLLSEGTASSAVYRLIVDPGSGTLVYLADNKLYGLPGESGENGPPPIIGRVIYIGNPVV